MVRTREILPHQILIRVVRRMSDTQIASRLCFAAQSLRPLMHLAIYPRASFEARLAKYVRWRRFHSQIEDPLDYSFDLLPIGVSFLLAKPRDKRMNPRSDTTRHTSRINLSQRLARVGFSSEAAINSPDVRVVLRSLFSSLLSMEWLWGNEQLGKPVHGVPGANGVSPVLTLVYRVVRH